MEIYFQCKLHGQKTIQVADFGLVYDIMYVCLFLKYLEISDLFIFLIKIYFFVVFQENSCNFFRWRDREDVDIRSKFVILRLANKINELDIVDESHMKRSTKWGMKEKKKTKCGSIWKLMLVFFVFFLVFLSITKKNFVEDTKLLCSCVQPIQLSSLWN